MLRRGITLIEVLVVLVIISILVALCFPAFSKAKDAAHKTVKKSDDHQETLRGQIVEAENP